MEHRHNQDTSSSLPVIARLDRLDRLIQLLEEKRSLSRRDLRAVEGNKECKTLSSALEEVRHKGTLMERLVLLEKRAIELSTEVDEGDASRSSSSTVQGSEMTGKNGSELLKRKDENGNTTYEQQAEDPTTIQAQVRDDSSPVYNRLGFRARDLQEKASPADEVMKEMTASHRSRKRRTKSHKWPWLFRHAC